MTIAVVGGGSWGTALAIHLGRQGHAVRLWAREPEVVEGILSRRRNPWYVADVDVPEAVVPTGDLAGALAGAEVVIVAVPSEYVRATLAGLGGLPPRTCVVSATKGLDPGTHARMSELIAARFPDARVAALSGPTFAREVALGRPTACVIASADEPLALQLQQALGSREFRLYTNRDVVGVEMGGALKNVIAVATGIADGLGLGENARAALITRGLAEMTRLAVALGGQPATLAGLAGMGDLVLTCTGSLSRNRALGMALAQGRSQEALERETRMVAEGARTVGSALALAARTGVSLPISEELAAVLRDGKPPAEALAALLGRPFTREDARVARV
ncbi:MAG: NAD(P)-dependent glycerol-3-phosphate dehydrogenase [Candidatus Rokubacteria bacterium]|nr:NAD(P)-dependent glycerol-3-phosphate dehydrogenase [Candidatus Rokubacteria bacterium]MBI3825470.1 NAD(P)-dependent glycerol-3-phosphate dehydrogenase [Candidatus Rokubacteria bacterium]